VREKKKTKEEGKKGERKEGKKNKTNGKTLLGG
jgi:hypothetical protein